MPEFDTGDPAFGKKTINNAADLQQVLDQFLKWNRMDLVERVVEWVAGTPELSGKPSLSAERRAELVEGRIQKAKDRPAMHPEGDDSYLVADHHDWFPDLPPGLPIHTHSKIAFLRGGSGHGFTGLVALRDSNKFYRETMAHKEDEAAARTKGPKIFLFPLQADNVEASGNSKARGVRPVGPVEAQVYKSRHTEAIVHGGPGQASHAQLSDMIAEAEHGRAEKQDIYSVLSQDKADFIGFTIFKGGSNGLPNRYAFTSASSNSKVFCPAKWEKQPGVSGVRPAKWTIGGGSQYVNRQWALRIQEACDGLLGIQAEFDQDLARLPYAELYQRLKSA